MAEQSKELQQDPEKARRDQAIADSVLAGQDVFDLEKDPDTNWSDRDLAAFEAALNAAVIEAYNAGTSERIRAREKSRDGVRLPFDSTTELDIDEVVHPDIDSNDLSTEGWT